MTATTFNKLQWCPVVSAPRNILRFPVSRHIPTHWPIVLTALLLTISTSNDNCFWCRKLIIYSCSVFFVKQDRYHCVTYPVGIRTTPPSWQCIHTRTLAEFGYNGPLWPGGACAPQQSIVQCFLGRAVNTNSSVVVQSHWRKGWIFIDRFENWLGSRELFLMGTQENLKITMIRFRFQLKRTKHDVYSWKEIWICSIE